MGTSAAQQKYKELRNKIAEAKKTLEETAKGLFTEMSAELFSENPELISFGWTAYTPYFNDGDECVFRCNGAYPTVSMMVENDLVSYDSNFGELEINGKEITDASAIIENGKTISYDPETGVVTKDGIKVLTYDEYDSVAKKVSAFMINFEDEDMKVMFGDHVQVTVHRDGKIETKEYLHD